LSIRLEAKPGKEKEVEQSLLTGPPVVRDEPGTIAWIGLRLGPSRFGIFDAFPDDAGRQAHLSGKVAGANRNEPNGSEDVQSRDGCDVL
jgi:quinol monooxygenase YgiN